MSVIAERYRTFWPRLWAGVIDGAILMCVDWFLLEFVTMLANDQRRAVHDSLAGTVVVRDA